MKHRLPYPGNRARRITPRGKGRDVGGGGVTGSDECKFKDVPVERAALASYC